MNRFIRNLPLPGKLLLLGIFPLILLIILAFQQHKQRLEKIATLENYLKQIDLSYYMTTLVDELQAERRFAFDYALSGANPSEMVQQRNRTNTALEALLLFEGDLAQQFREYTFLNDLYTLRKDIDGKKRQAFDVMSFYTIIIFRLGIMNNATASYAQYLQPVQQELTGQRLLSEMVTYMGMARSNVYYILYTKYNDKQISSSTMQTYDIFESFIKEFNFKSSPASIRTFRDLAAGGPLKETVDYFSKARKQGYLDTTVAADKWWSVSSDAVDRIRFLQQTMLDKVRKESRNIYEDEVQKKNWSLLILVVAITVVVLLIFYISRIISDTLNRLQEAAQTISSGGTGVSLPPKTRDAMGSLARSIRDIDDTNRAISDAARRIGSGDFDVPLQTRSADDVLVSALVKMKENLRAYQEESGRKLWIQQGISHVNDCLRGEKDVDTLSRDVLNELVSYTGSSLGLFYVTGNNELRFSAGYALSDARAVPQVVRPGETLVGQVFLKGEILELQEVPDDFLRVTSGSGSARPRHLLLLPLVQNGVVEGVIELATIAAFREGHRELIAEVGHNIAVALQSARNRARVQELLEETQAQSEELQAQHSELENMNSELEAQAHRLQASEEELKVQQEELMQTNEELEERSRLLEDKNQLIVERNLEIQKKAEELELSTKYKSEFLANMSHELRTPLNSILLLSRLLTENNEKNLSKDQVEYAEVIQTSGKGLLSLIDEILDLSKIEAGKMDLEYAPVPVADVTDGLKALFVPIALERGVQFSVEVGEGVPALMETDRLRLEQILRNLLSNALKFTPRGSVRLVVAAPLSPAGTLSFSVIDTGIGIPKDKQGVIFEAFQQADGSTRRKFGGTGLGLSISRELARLLGGSIRLSSEPGQGSTFTVTVPVNRVPVTLQEASGTGEENERRETVPAVSGNGIPAESRKRFTAPSIPLNIPDDRADIQPNDKVLLVVEDDTSFARALLDFARSKGYKGIVAVRGDEGVELAQQYLPLGILLDLQLPVRDGWEVMEELKSNPRTRHIPVHIMSSLEARRESIMKGAVDFINKPVAIEGMQEIIRKIEHVLNKKSRKVLIVEENPRHARALAYYLENFDVQSHISHTIEEGVEALRSNETDCVILDMGIPDSKAYQTLESVKKSSGMEDLPVIIFTGRSLSGVEEQKIKQYADSIVIKTAHSYQRILDEVSLFLHLVEEKENGTRTGGLKKLGSLQDVLRGKTILITDDDVRNIFSLTKALEGHKMNVLTAIDGKEALQQLEEHPHIDVVLMDIMMPEMDGYETMKRIRMKGEWKDLPVIAVTAKAMTGDREKCIQAGASDYISKPVDVDQLLSLLRVWLYEKNN